MLRGSWRAQKSSPGDEKNRQPGAKLAQESHKEAHLDTLGVDFWWNFGENGCEDEKILETLNIVKSLKNTVFFSIFGMRGVASQEKSIEIGYRGRKIG